MEKKSALKLSIVVPVGPQDMAWIGLLSDFQRCESKGVELIFSATAPAPTEFANVRKQLGGGYKLNWISGSSGRGRQLNRGAAAARGEFIWFLHADTRLGEMVTVERMLKILEKNPEALHFFDLKFLNDGPRLLAFNEIGVWIRSHALGLPFGDQGLAFKRKLFWKLGGFRENAPYGEDHLFIWAAKHAAIKLQATGLPIYTSARKYEREGWLWTTCRHMWLTFYQALPEVLSGDTK